MAKGRGSGPPQRCQAGPARPAPLLGQLDAECQIGKSLANRAWRTSSQTSDGVGLTIDVSKTQRRLRIREDEWRLLLFQRRGKLYHFTVYHCGARFSACMVELDARQCSHASATNSFSSHFLQHGGWPQAYDVLFRLEATTAPLVAVCTCYFLHLLGCPISWHKIALGRQVPWIGLDMDQLDQTRGTEPWKSTGEWPDKAQRWHALTWNASCLLTWLAKYMPALRPWLSDFYLALARPTATLLSIFKDSVRRSRRTQPQEGFDQRFLSARAAH